MITIPMLLKQDLEIFKGKKVVLYSQHAAGIKVYKCLKYCDVEVVCFCKEKLGWKQRVKDKIRGVVDITPAQLPSYMEKYSDIIIQSVAFDYVQIQHVYSVAKQLGAETSSIASGEIINAFSPFIEWKALKNPLCFWWRKIRRQQKFAGLTDFNWIHLRQKKIKNQVLICSPAKTADHSFMYTFDALNSGNHQQCTSDKIEYINTWHSPRVLKRVISQTCIEKGKVILGVRDPVSQNLSEFYQRLSSGTLWGSLLFVSLEYELTNNIVHILEQYERQFQTDAGNVQIWWNNYVEPYTKTKKKLGDEKVHTGYIQNFIPMFQNQVLDILAYPFNKEKGYTIIKEGNIEIFVYQLEKLNTFVPELSEWLGVPFDKLENGNQASDKWIAESYKQAQKEIEITQEYFDKCFDEPYVKHCYSEADIEKFKARWRPHIKKNA